MNKQTDNKISILNCALKLFSEKGYESVSVQELVNMANITKPTLYYYFGSKEGLYNQILVEYYDQLNKLLNNVCIYKANPESYFEDIYPILVNLASSYFIFAKNNQLFYRLVLSNLYMPKSSPIYQVMEKYHFTQYDIIFKMFNNMASIHTNLKGKEKQLTWSFLGIINTYISLYLNDHPTSLTEDLAKQLVHQFMHGIYA